MTLFWIIAALLIAVALLFVLPPLLRRSTRPGVAALPYNALNVAVYRDQQRELEADRRAGTLSDEQYQRAQLELQRRMLEDVAADPAPVAARPASRVPAIVVGLAMPLLAVGLYFAVGNLRALAPVAIPHSSAQGDASPEHVKAMVDKLAERMRQNPDDPQGWVMLARSYMVLGRYEDSSAAYGKAVERVPDNADLLADYADALAMAHGQDLQGEPESLIMRALKMDPVHVKALALAGTVAFDRKDYAAALRHWDKLATLVPPDSEIARNVQSSIAEARSLAGAKDNKVADSPADKPADKSIAVKAAEGVSGTVALAPALAAKAAPGDTVFIFARAAEGSRMPLAILRKKVSDLPIAFTLDDSMAMSPATRLSGVSQVVIGVRVSKSGNAVPQPGDLQGSSAPVSSANRNVAVVIDTEVH